MDQPSVSLLSHRPRYTLTHLYVVVQNYRVVINDQDDKIGFKRKVYEEDSELKEIRDEADNERNA